MTHVLIRTPLLLLCCSFASSTLDVDLERLPQEPQSQDDCSLMQVSQVSIKHARDDRDDHQMNLSRTVHEVSRAQFLYRELMDRSGMQPWHGSAFSFEVDGMAISTYSEFGLIIFGLVVAAWLLRNFIDISFRNMPLLSFFFFFFFLLGTFCRTLLPVMWYSARDIISHYSVFVLLSADIAIFVLMFTPLLLGMPDQATSQLLTSCLMGASEKRMPQQQAEVSRAKSSLPYHSLIVFQIASGVSVFLVARVPTAEEVDIAGPLVTTALYGILAWFSLTTLYDVSHPRISITAEVGHARVDSEQVLEASPQALGIIELVTAATTAAINDTIVGMYIHCILWVTYGIGMLLCSACLELRICYAILVAYQFYNAMVWVAISLSAWLLIVVLHMNIIQSHGKFIEFSSGDGWMWQTGKDTCSSICLVLKAVGIGSILIGLLCSAVGLPKLFYEDHFVRFHVMSVLFFIGLALVAAEEVIGLNKSAVMLVLAATEWAILGGGLFHTHTGTLVKEQDKDLLDVADIILFLIPAMSVVESIDHFQGFHIVTRFIQWVMKGKKERLMPVMCILVFLLSAVIDNLTSTLIALKILRRLVPDDDDWRHECGGIVVIASNAGGAWSPIGDVTTTMLWIKGKITILPTISYVFIPCLVVAMVPLFGVSLLRPQSNDEVARPDLQDADEITIPKVAVLCFGFAFIFQVPVLRILVGLPPYLGMLLALGLMWLVTDLLFLDKEEKSHGTAQRGVIAAIFKVDLASLLFITGVLLSVGALNSSGALKYYANNLREIFGDNMVSLCTVLGISSSAIDNVPLVEAAIDMFPKVPQDDQLWQLVALAGGTGGSILAIGSVPGVALMSIEGVSFVWYCKRISLWAFLGYTLGIGAYRLQSTIISF